MMTGQTIKVKCKNNGQTLEVPVGTNMEKLYEISGLSMNYGPVSVKVNNKVEGMHYRVYKQKEVEFLDLYSGTGLRAYTRTRLPTTCGHSAKWLLTFPSVTAIM